MSEWKHEFAKRLPSVLNYGEVAFLNSLEVDPFTKSLTTWKAFRRKEDT